MQGAGGVKIAPSTYWPEVQRIVDKYGILLLADEVITGFGRLGTWFASDFYGIKPNLITFAKAATSGYIPLSGVLVDDKIVEALMSNLARKTAPTVSPQAKAEQSARELRDFPPPCMNQ